MEKIRGLLQQTNVTFAFSALLITFYAVASNSHQAQIAQRPVEAQTSRVSVREVSDAPLRIIAVDNNQVKSTPQLDLVVVNISNKPISAYAIRYDVASGQTPGGVELSIAVLPRAILQPNQSALTDVGAGELRGDAIDSILVSLDFVEFTDGSTWGADIHKSAEKIAGQRAGARAALQYLLRISQSKGSSAILEAIEAEGFDSPIPPDHSPEWASGFQSGVGHIKGRLIQAYKEGGVASIESTLRQPIDALDRR